MTGQAVWRRGGPGQGAATGRKRARCAVCPSKCAHALRTQESRYSRWNRKAGSCFINGRDAKGRFVAVLRYY